MIGIDIRVAGVDPAPSSSSSTSSTICVVIGDLEPIPFGCANSGGSFTIIESCSVDDVVKRLNSNSVSCVVLGRHGRQKSRGREKHMKMEMVQPSMQHLDSSMNEDTALPLPILLVAQSSIDVHVNDTTGAVHAKSLSSYDACISLDIKVYDLTVNPLKDLKISRVTGRVIVDRQYEPTIRTSKPKTRDGVKEENEENVENSCVLNHTNDGPDSNNVDLNWMPRPAYEDFDMDDDYLEGSMMSMSMSMSHREGAGRLMPLPRTAESLQLSQIFHSADKQQARSATEVSLSLEDVLKDIRQSKELVQGEIDKKIKAELEAKQKQELRMSINLKKKEKAKVQNRSVQQERKKKVKQAANRVQFLPTSRSISFFPAKAHNYIYTDAPKKTALAQDKDRKMKLEKEKEKEKQKNQKEEKERKPLHETAKHQQHQHAYLRKGSGAGAWRRQVSRELGGGERGHREINHDRAVAGHTKPGQRPRKTMELPPPPPLLSHVAPPPDPSSSSIPIQQEQEQERERKERAQAEREVATNFDLVAAMKTRDQEIAALVLKRENLKDSNNAKFVGTSKTKAAPEHHAALRVGRGVIVKETKDASAIPVPIRPLLWGGAIQFTA